MDSRSVITDLDYFYLHLHGNLSQPLFEVVVQFDLKGFVIEDISVWWNVFNQTFNPVISI